MKRFVTGQARGQATLFPEYLEDYITEDNPVRVIDVYVDELDLRDLGFPRVDPFDTGRPAYHPAMLLKLYVYGYLNLVQSSRRLERESQRNLELMWLTERLTPDHKTIANFRKDNGKAIRKVCREFIVLCRGLELFSEAVVAIDGSKFKAVNNRDRNFTAEKMKRRLQGLEGSIARYLAQLDNADRQECAVTEAESIKCREHEAVLEAAQERLDRKPETMRLRRQTLEHPFGTIKLWMGYTHFLTKTLPRVRTEMSLHVLAYNLKRVMNILGVGEVLEAMRA